MGHATRTIHNFPVYLKFTITQAQADGAQAALKAILMDRLKRALDTSSDFGHRLITESQIDQYIGA